MFFTCCHLKFRMITAPAGVMSRHKNSMTLLIVNLIVNVKFIMLKFRAITFVCVCVCVYLCKEYIGFSPLVIKQIIVLSGITFFRSINHMLIMILICLSQIILGQSDNYSNLFDQKPCSLMEMNFLSQFLNYHSAKAQPNCAVCYPFCSPFLKGRHLDHVMAPLRERYPSLSTQAMCGSIILQWPCHFWPPVGSSSCLEQIGGGAGQQTLSPFHLHYS